MNKLSKILLIIIFFLCVSLVILGYLYIKSFKSTIKYYNELIKITDDNKVDEVKESNLDDLPDKEEKLNFNENLKIAYSNPDDIENSEFIFMDNDYKSLDFKDYIVENKTITKDMEGVDFSKFEDLGDEFYSLRITDYETYNQYAENYNLRKLKETDFENIFVEFIIRKSSDFSIISKDIIESADYTSNDLYRVFPISKDAILDVSEDFLYPCIIGYFPNYMNKHFDNFYFKVLVQNQEINVSKEKALDIATKYLSELVYNGCYNFTSMDYVRFENVYGNNFLEIEDKENPIDDRSKLYTVWAISAYSENDPCTWAEVYVDTDTGKIIGGNLNWATD